MKKFLKYIPYISLALNILFILIWIRVFNNHDDHTDRVNEFDSILPGKLSGNYYSVALIVITIISIIGFAQSNSLVSKILLVIQLLFLSLFIFQYL